MDTERKRLKIINEITAVVKKKATKKEIENISLFNEIYFANVAYSDIESSNIEQLAHEAMHLFEYAQHKKTNEIKVRAYNTTDPENPCHHHHTVIEIINDNMPFLVDSTVNIINYLGLPIYLLVHPVVLVKRDSKGNLEKVFERTEQHKDANYESFIRCELTTPCSQEKLETIEHKLKEVLSDVRRAVDDWHKITGKLYEVITQLKSQNLYLNCEEMAEGIDFLEWSADHHFTFLGYCEYDLVKGSDDLRYLKAKHGMGLFRHENAIKFEAILEGFSESEIEDMFAATPCPVIVSKTIQLSTVHRRDPMDTLTIKRYDNNGKFIGVSQFYGLFTSVVYHRSTANIPLIRRKTKQILQKSGFSENWHDGKALNHILETFPRDELFQGHTDWLYETAMSILQLQDRQRLSLFIRPDSFGRYVSCLVYIPRDRYDSELRMKIASILENEYNGKVKSWQIQLSEVTFARLHFIIEYNEKAPDSFRTKTVQTKLSNASLSWKDLLSQEFISNCGLDNNLELFDRYSNSFSKGYQEKFSAKSAIEDIEHLERSISTRDVSLLLYKNKDEGDSEVHLKIYSSTGEICLSDIIPIFEKLNLRVQNESLFSVRTSGSTSPLFIHEYHMLTINGDPISLKNDTERFTEAFKAIWKGHTENDGFNRLVLGAKFTWEEAQIMRAYSRYLKQIRIPYSQAYIQDALLKNAEVTRKLLALFYARFNPQEKQNREKLQDSILMEITEKLESVDSADEDRILRRFINILLSTVRTNYFQTDKDGKRKNYFSFKVDCRKVEEMPLPRPLFEIFAFSSKFEAVHLRGGKVARGGIRWSDRLEDFRTEILGLVKAQIVKNAVIVPTGSKGGFVIKNPITNGTREEIMAEAVVCYKNMMRGLLDITDNLVKGKIVKPANVVTWDEDDTYLVVAADKGTATFSDFANEVSAEYNFWLGDAFASGGSAGYDHKKMGITAKGAWESVKHHFKYFGHDVATQDTTVVGVGDMSGDVFGNGMLLSRKLKLVAAFNHMHIFIDPNPDPEKSFKERERLFNLPRSAWSDYDAKLISKGGGIFERKAKSITLSKEIQDLLQVDSKSLAPHELIQAILKAEVDLVWFGGIGTYVKASNETNVEVGDRVNDLLRIDGCDIRAKVVAEGANLGVTQRGRIEYALKGGRINTDAIDNSAGVDCSDHEVNIKILYGTLLETGRITKDERNNQLEKMTDDVSKLVLRDNIWQNRSISMIESQAHKLLEEQVELIHALEKEGLLNRKLEFLPDDVELTRRLADKQGLTRPELAVLLAYAKNSLSSKFINSKLPDLPYLNSKLLGYFPEMMRKNFEDDIRKHPLKRELITTIITNSVVNRMGMTMINDLEKQSGRDASSIVEAYLVVREVYGLEKFWSNVDSLQEIMDTKSLTKLNFHAYKAIKRYVKWFMRFGGKTMDFDQLIHAFKEPLEELKTCIGDLLSTRLKSKFEQQLKFNKELGIPDKFAYEIAGLDPLLSAFDIITIADATKQAPTRVARLYFAISEALHVDWFSDVARQNVGDSRWEQGAVSSIIEELMNSLKAITLKVIKSHKNIDKLVNKDGSLAQEVMQIKAIENMVQELASSSKVDVSMLIVAARTLRTISEAA